MAYWETDEAGDVVFEPVEGFTLRHGTFGEPPVPRLLLRLQLSRRSIQIQVDIDEAQDMVKMIQNALSELDQSV